MPMGTFRFATTPKPIAVWWRNHCDVFAISTIHSASAGTVMKRPKRLQGEKTYTYPLSNSHLRLQPVHGLCGFN